MYHKAWMKLKISKRNRKESKTKEVTREKTRQINRGCLETCADPGKPDPKLQGPQASKAMISWGGGDGS